MCAVFGVSFAAAQLAKDMSLSGSVVSFSKDPDVPLGIQGVLRETRNPRWTSDVTMTSLVGIDQLVIQTPDGGFQDFRVQGVRKSSDGVRFESSLKEVLFFRFPTQELIDGNVDFFDGEVWFFDLPVAYLRSSFSNSVEQRVVSRSTDLSFSTSAEIKFSTNFASSSQRSAIKFFGVNGLGFVGNSLYGNGRGFQSVANMSLTVLDPNDSTAYRGFAVGMWCMASSSALSDGLPFFSMLRNVGNWDNAPVLAVKVDGTIISAQMRDLLNNLYVVNSTFTRDVWHKVIVTGNQNNDLRFCVFVDSAPSVCTSWTLSNPSIQNQKSLFFLSGGLAPMSGRIASFVAAQGSDAVTAVLSALNSSSYTPGTIQDNVTCLSLTENFVQGVSSLSITGQADLQLDSLHLVNAVIAYCRVVFFFFFFSFFFQYD